MKIDTVVLKQRLTYIKYLYINSGYRELYKKIIGEHPYPEKYASKKVLESGAGNDLIKEKLIQGTPFMAARFGSGELRGIVHAIGVELKLRKKIKESTITGLCYNAGFFPPTQDAVIKFAGLMMALCRQLDLICVWMNVMEDYVIKTYAPQTQLSRLRAVEPYYHNNPWSKALEGKKVLVIHPFEKTIRSQYSKRKLLFTNKDILPEFELKTLKAVQTIAGQKCEFATWFEALDYMSKTALDMDFDIAIIGCGAYGFPLAAMLKQAGKQAVHMGGATQILFGIAGKKWDAHPIISTYYNRHWVRPLPQETPINSGFVENGCYW